MAYKRSRSPPPTVPAVKADTANAAIERKDSQGAGIDRVRGARLRFSPAVSPFLPVSLSFQTPTAICLRLLCGASAGLGVVAVSAAAARATSSTMRCARVPRVRARPHRARPRPRASASVRARRACE